MNAFICISINRSRLRVSFDHAAVDQSGQKEGGNSEYVCRRNVSLCQLCDNSVGIKYDERVHISKADHNERAECKASFKRSFVFQ